MVEFVASEDVAGRRVDAWAAQVLDVSRSRAVELISAGTLRLNGGTVKPRRHVRAGDVLSGDPAAIEPPAPFPVPHGRGSGESSRVPVVYDDDHVLVVDKPAGLVVHPGAGRRTDTLVSVLLEMGVPLAPAAGRLRPGVVHRLDRGTSGLLVLAKTDAAYWKLAQMVMRHELHREYLAIVAGHPRPAKGTIEASMARDSRNREKFTVVPAGGRAAVTHYRVERKIGMASLVCVTLATGRTHQIRVHFAALGWPVLGDRLYGERSPEVSITRQALHSTRLSFTHPVTGAGVSCSSDIPEDMNRLLAELAAGEAKG